MEKSIVCPSIGNSLGLLFDIKFGIKVKKEVQFSLINYPNEKNEFNMISFIWKWMVLNPSLILYLYVMYTQQL